MDGLCKPEIDTGVVLLEVWKLLNPSIETGVKTAVIFSSVKSKATQDEQALLTVKDFPLTSITVGSQGLNPSWF